MTSIKKADEENNAYMHVDREVCISILLRDLFIAMN